MRELLGIFHKYACNVASILFDICNYKYLLHRCTPTNYTNI